MFASFEGQGVRDERNWSLWAIWPDRRLWEPLMSSPSEANAFHFQAQLSDVRVAVTDYYNLNDNGFGTYPRLQLAEAARNHSVRISQRDRCVEYGRAMGPLGSRSADRLSASLHEFSVFPARPDQPHCVFPWRG
jgi:hypothetical protein